jgi:glycosyltransferase involved in cell wall biosynthesis
LIQAFEKLNHETLNLELHIAGAGEGFENLQSIVNQSKVRDKIILHGNLNQAEILTFYQSLQLYVHCSLAETQSTAILQAMAVGLPIIATNIPGNRELIINQQTGILVAVKNVNELKVSIESLIQNRTFSNELGQNARQKCLAEFTTTMQFSNYAKLISKA